jgi:hypothetical protein
MTIQDPCIILSGRFVPDPKEVQCRVTKVSSHTLNSFNKLLMQGQVFFSFRLEQISLFGDAVSTPSPN